MDVPIQSRRAWETRAVWIAQVCLLALLYAAAGHLGLAFASYQENATLIWPPTGIGLAALILYGPRLWPGVVLGALALNMAETGAGLSASLGIATGNGLESLVGAVLLARRGFRPNFERLEDTANFLRIGVFGCTTVSATIGVATLLVSGSIVASQVSWTWLTWWLGDLGGALIIAPALLMLLRGNPTWPSLLQRPEWWIVMTLLVVIGALAFSMTPGLYAFAATVAPFPVLVWASSRLGTRGAAAASFILIVIAMVASAVGSGPFVMGDPTEAMVLLWTYSILMAITAYSLAAVTEQRNFAELRYRNEEIERLNIEKEKLLLLERERLTREMHDGLGGQLVSALSMVERGAGTPGEVAEVLRRALDDIRIVIDSLDHETTDLPTALGKLRARLAPLLRRNDVNLVWRVEDVPGVERIEADGTLHVLRIVQESVTNALRHAKPTTVEVNVAASSAPGTLRVVVRDDGAGLPPVVSRSSRGLQNMYRRAESLGGVIRIDDAHPGTQVELMIPLPR